MKTVKQLLENHEKSKVSISKTEQNILNLVRSGLLEEGKTHILRRSLVKDPALLTVAEKRIVLDVLGELISEKTEDHLTKMDKAQDNTNTELPAVIILKRKAIRVYPDKQKIGLYYSQALDKYISIPYGPSHHKNISAQITEETDPQVLSEAVQEEPTKQYATIEESFDAKLARIRAERMLEEGEALDSAKVFGSNALNTTTFGASRFLSNRARAGFNTFKKNLAGQDTDYSKELADQEEKQKQSDEEHPIAAKAGEIAGYLGALATGSLLAKGAAKVGGKVLSRIAGGSEGAAEATAGQQAAVDTAKEMAASKAVAPAGTAGSTVKVNSPRQLTQRRVTPLKRANQKTPPTTPTKLSFVDRLKSAVTTAADAGSDAFKPVNNNFQFHPGASYNAPVSAPPIASLPGQARINSQLGFGIDPYRKNKVQESNLSVLKNMVENNISNCTITFGDNSISINNRMAKKLVKVYESLNRKNKNNMEKMLNESATSFTNVVNFSVRQ